MYDDFEVEADSLDEAIDKVYSNDDNQYCIGGKGEYVDDSFLVDYELAQTLNKKEENA